MFLFKTEAETTGLTGRFSWPASFASERISTIGAVTNLWQFMQTFADGMPACRLFSAPKWQ